MMTALKILKGLAIAYGLVCALMWGLQRHLQYVPQRHVEPPAHYGLTDFQDIAFSSMDGTAIHAWYHPARAGHPTVIYFHGNGGNLSGRAHYDGLLAKAGFGVFALSYRGYGNSESSPTEAGIYQDARASIAYVTQTLGTPLSQVVLYGESLGTGVAVQMATEFPAAALVLQSPYTSITDAASIHYPWLPVRLLLKDRFDSLSKISRVTLPLLVLHGERDTVVPIALGKTLFEHANEPKESIYFPITGHVDFDLEVLADTVADFAEYYTRAPL